MSSEYSADVLVSLYRGLGWEPNVSLYEAGQQLLAAAEAVPVINAQGAPFYAQGTYNPTTRVGPDDTAALQAFINFIQLTGARGYLPAGYYKITSPLTISAPIRLVGDGAQDLFGNITTNGANSQQFPYMLVGSIIVPCTASQNGLDITISGASCGIEDIGIMFDSPIKFLNTGHGIFSTSPLIGAGPYQQPGLVRPKFRNIEILGHDGNHYGVVLTNSFYGSFYDLGTYGGGGRQLLQNSNTCDYGNTAFFHPFHNVMIGGSAHGVWLNNAGTASGSSYQLDIVHTFSDDVFFQVPNPAIAGTTPPASPQQVLAQTGKIVSVATFGTDWETGITGTGPSPGGGSTANPSSTFLANIIDDNLSAMNWETLASGNIVQNLCGAPLNAWLTITYNFGSASIFNITIGPNSDASGGNVFDFSFPSGASGKQTIPFYFPAGWYFTLNYNPANVTAVTAGPIFPQ